MKKVLALILTAAMLLSCMIVGISAVREHATVVGETTSFKAAVSGANFCGESDYAKKLSNSGLSTYTLKMVVKACTADFGDPSEMVAYLAGTPSFHFANGKVGMNGVGELDYTFADDTWYTIEWIVDGDTTIVINGETVGTLSGSKNACVYGTLYRGYLDEIAVYDADGNWFWGDDMEDGGDDVFASDVTEFTAKGNEYDLGMKYWMFHEGNNYAPINVGNQGSNFDIEMDICLDADNSEFGMAWNDGLAKTPRIATSYIGVGKSTIDYTFKTGVWYHVKWDANDGETAIYVDDAYVGTVGETATLYDGTQMFYQWVLLSIDNLKVGSYFCDMENGIGDYQGQSMEYDFEPVTEETIFDHIPAPKYEGTAYLLENSWDGTSNYVEQGNLGNLGDHYIVDYNIAVLPTNDSADGNFFEIWTNWNAGSPVRWKVGTEFAGKDNDLVQIEWGEATIDNFHRVTIEFKNNRGYLYLDGQEIYNGLCGSYKDLSIMIMMPWNASIVLDDFAIYDGEYNLIKDYSDLRTGSVGNNTAKWVNLDAADFCAENGCTTGKTVMEYDSTCYSTGNNQTFCAVCGNVKDNHEIALKDHVWVGYDMNRKTDNGLVYTYCKNEGCVEKRYTEVPKNYEGKLYQFYDMQDDMVLVVGDEKAVDSYSGLDKYLSDTDGNVVECWKAVDGKLEFLGQAVYDEFWGIESAKMPVNDWSISYDFFLDESKHWTNEDGGVDYECFFIRCCGAAGYQLQVGWDRINEQLFIRKTDGSKVLATCDYTFEDLTTYNFKVACKYEGYGYTHEDDSFEAPWYAEIAIFVNGEKVLAYGDLEGIDQYAIYDIAYGTDLGAYHKFPTFGQFGTSYTIDNLAFGSYDFEIVKVAGDIDGDGELTAADATMMRQYLAGIISADDFVDASVADVNGDGAINAKDQLMIRIALAA